MAYIDQKTKAILSPAIREVCKKYGVKCTISIPENLTLRVTLTEGPIQFGDARDYRTWRDHEVNTYWFQSQYSGTAVQFLTELILAMKGEIWYKDTKSEVDYYDIAYYLCVRVGRPSKPYRCTTLNTTTIEE